MRPRAPAGYLATDSPPAQRPGSDTERGQPFAVAGAPAWCRRMAAIDTEPGFDTLARAQRLKAAGVEDKQAEAHAAAARDSQAGRATKTDLDDLEAP